MVFEKRNCNIEMHLERLGICGQRGYLKINREEFPFATTDGMGQFFGQLMHTLYGLLCLPEVNRNSHPGLSYDMKEPMTCAEGEVLWDYCGRSVRWKISRLLSNAPLYEDFLCTLKIQTNDKERIFEFEFRELCYAVAKCGTEILKTYGIVGYTILAEEFEDFNMKEFLEIKTFALGLEQQMGFIAMFYSKDKESCSSLESEIDLILFDM